MGGARFPNRDARKMLGVNRCGSVIGKLQADRQSQKYTPGSETASRLNPSLDRIVAAGDVYPDVLLWGQFSPERTSSKHSSGSKSHFSGDLMNEVDRNCLCQNAFDDLSHFSTLAEHPNRSSIQLSVFFDTGVFPADNSASRRCEMQCATILERVTRNRLVPVYP